MRHRILASSTIAVALVLLAIVALQGARTPSQQATHATSATPIEATAPTGEPTAATHPPTPADARSARGRDDNAVAPAGPDALAGEPPSSGNAERGLKAAPIKSTNKAALIPTSAQQPASPPSGAKAPSEPADPAPSREFE